MPQLVHTDSVFRVDPGVTPPYDTDNPLLRLLGLVETTRLVGAREVYEHNSLQYLFPLTWLQLWGPSAPETDNLDPARQDTKTDFQKQNVRDFRLGDTRAVRGWAVVGGQRIPMLQLSYRAGPDSALAQTGANLGEAIGLHRHRDNQEIFLMLDGDGIMVVGDWADSGTRTRSFEVRALTAGSLAMLRGGNLHGLANPTDRRASLFMFGGYD